MATKIEDSSESVNSSEREKSGDAVNHPPHYNVGKIEVIDAIEAWRLGFCLGNAVKYIARAGRKAEEGATEIESGLWLLKKVEVRDLKKALWYVKRAMVNFESDDFCRNLINDEIGIPSMPLRGAIRGERVECWAYPSAVRINDWKLDFDAAAVLAQILHGEHQKAQVRLENLIDRKVTALKLESEELNK